MDRCCEPAPSKTMYPGTAVSSGNVYSTGTRRCRNHPVSTKLDLELETFVDIALEVNKEVVHLCRPSKRKVVTKTNTETVTATEEPMLVKRLSPYEFRCSVEKRVS